MATVAVRLVTAAGFSKPTISSRIVILHLYLNLKMSVFGLKEIMLIQQRRHYDLEKTRADWPDQPNVALPLVRWRSHDVTSRHS